MYIVGIEIFTCFPGEIEIWKVYQDGKREILPLLSPSYIVEVGSRGLKMIIAGGYSSVTIPFLTSVFSKVSL